MLLFVIYIYIIYNAEEVVKSPTLFPSTKYYKYKCANRQEYIGNEPFMLTYGDGVCDVDISALMDFHKEQGRVVTLTGVQPEGRFGIMDIEGVQIQSFREKDREDTGWINGGYMVVEPTIFDYIDGDDCILERKPLETLAAEGRLDCYKHDGFWQCMDTLRDKEKLEKMITNGTAPWVYWK